MSFAQEKFLLSQAVENHQIEENTEQSQRHVCGHHDHSPVHSCQQLVELFSYIGDGDGSRNVFLPSVMFNGKESVRFAVLKRENGFPE